MNQTWLHTYDPSSLLSFCLLLGQDLWASSILLGHSALQYATLQNVHGGINSIHLNHKEWTFHCALAALDYYLFRMAKYTSKCKYNQSNTCCIDLNMLH